MCVRAGGGGGLCLLLCTDWKNAACVFRVRVFLPPMPAFHVGILPKMPGPLVYTRLATDAFRVADADNSGEIDVEEFIR